MYLTSLFGVQLHNHSFLDRHIDIFAFRQSQDFASHSFTVEFQPVRRAAADDEFERACYLNIFLHLLLDGDFLSDGDLIRRDVHLFAVHEHMPVTDKLPRLSVRCRKAEPDEHVVQATLELRQQVFAGDALLADSLLEVGTELILQNTVDTLYFLFFTQLESVTYNFRLTIPPMLTWREITFFDSA